MVDLTFTADKKTALEACLENGCIKTFTTLKAKKSAAIKIAAAGDTETVSFTDAEISALYEFVKFTKFGGEMTEAEETVATELIEDIEAVLPA